MKPISIIKLIQILLIISISPVWAVSKNEPDERDAEETLKEIGKMHWVDDMDVDEIGSVKVEDHVSGEDTFFHIFTSYIEDTEKCRIIIFDNEQEYLGYYVSRHWQREF